MYFNKAMDPFIEAYLYIAFLNLRQLDIRSLRTVAHYYAFLDLFISLNEEQIASC